MNRKQLTILLCLSGIILISQSGNTLSARDKKKASLPVIQKDTLHSMLQVVYAPEELGMSSVRLTCIDSIIKDGIQQRVFPGCQVVVTKDGKTVYDKCFGNYTYEAPKPVTPTTLYDLASLSKTTGTLLAIMKLYDDGKLKLTDKASAYLTFLRGTDKENITITELLFHESGLPAGLPFHSLPLEKNNTPSFLANTKDSSHYVRLNSSKLKYKEDWVSRIPTPEFTMQVGDSFYVHNRLHEAAMKMIAKTYLGSKTYVYSCVNFIVLKEIVESISGTSMDVFLDKKFYQPMKLNNMAYLPLRTHKKEDIAPTIKKDFLRNGMIQGFVHDPDAAFLGGVSGNAGLFATATDVAKVYQMILNNGELDGTRYLSAETCKLFTTTASASGRRYLGFDKSVTTNPQHSPCCASAPAAVYGHTGYTGTCCWVDPVSNLVYVFLSNRTYPDDGANKLAKTGVRTKIQEVIYQSIMNQKPQIGALK